MKKAMMLRIVGGMAAVGAATLAAYVLAIRPRIFKWSASSEEERRPLPGDLLIPQATWQKTHAITINAPVSEVWPWLAQMGAGRRAGWYSYDRIDNRGVPSAEWIVPALQHLNVGDVLPSVPEDEETFVVVAVAPLRHATQAIDRHQTADRANKQQLGPSFGSGLMFPARRTA